MMIPNTVIGWLLWFLAALVFGFGFSFGAYLFGRLFSPSPPGAAP